MNGRRFTPHRTRGRLLTLAAAVAAAVALACAPSTPAGEGGDDMPGDAATPAGWLELLPAEAELTVEHGVPAQLDYVAVWHDAGGSQDVTAETSFTLDDERVASFTGATLTARGLAAGRRKLHAAARGASADAVVVVRVRARLVQGDAPADAPGRFEVVTDDPQRAPRLLYPLAETLVPPNLGRLDVLSRNDAGNDLFEARLTTEWLDVRVYSGRTSPASFVQIEGALWRLIADSAAGEAVDVRVRGLNRTGPALSGTSATATILLAREPVVGGLYYWGAARQEIYRYDFGTPDVPASSFFGAAQAGHCVGCHALSRDGSRMVVTYDGGGGGATVIDVSSRTPLFAGDGSVMRSNFASFLPDGASFVSVSGGVLVWRDSATGQALAEVATGFAVTHPDVSPDGKQLTWVRRTGGDDLFVGGDAGHLYTQSFDAASGAAGTPTLLVAAPAGRRACYPSFSPDGRWVLYNLTDNDCYDDGGAQIWVVKADGTQAPARLAAADVDTGLTNSWPRWAPFAQRTGGAADEPLFWFTVSSKRSFGVRKDHGRPQLWMGPFFPERAADPVAASRPLFWLPFQDLESGNHIAQWAEALVSVE